MNPLRENEKEKNQKKEIERIHHPHPRACEGVEIQAYSEAWQRGFNTQVFNDIADHVGLTFEQRKAWLKYMHEVGWCFYDGKPVTSINCHRSMRMWRVVDERKAAENGRSHGCAGGAIENEYERIKRLEALRRVEMSAKPENWELCRERCAMFLRGKCSMGRKIPPQLRERPVAPEECPQFKGKEVR